MGAVVSLAVLLLASTPSTEPLAVDIQELPVPTADAFPHDPAVAPDGAVWVTEQKTNKLARLDPKTQTFREYPLKTPDSGPHGLVVDSAGNVWFTANYKGYVGKLDPASGEVTEYPMPDAVAKDPHTPVLGANGTVWFTVQSSNFVGKLDSKTGKIQLKPMPTPNAEPYGVVIGSDGAPYVCELGSNKIARIDPDSMAIREYSLPSGARPRRIARAPNGLLYFSDFAGGKLGRLDPNTGDVREWPSPGGSGSQPYGIAVTPDGRVWYSESGVDPNTLVSFDPRTERFASTPIPSGGGVVRNMAATPDGRLYLACSGKNRVAIVTPRESK